jgi:transcriptional regulator with XRE-family HTH domain
MDEESNFEIGRKIKEIRKKRGLTLSQLSEETGSDLSTLSRYEKGERIVPISILKKISETTDCNIKWLIGLEDEDMEKSKTVYDPIEANENLYRLETNSVYNIKFITQMFSPFHWTEDFLEFKIKQYIGEKRLISDEVDKFRMIMRQRKKEVTEKMKNKRGFEIIEIISDITLRRFFQHRSHIILPSRIKLQLINNIIGNKNSFGGRHQFIFLDTFVPINIEIIDNASVNVLYYLKYEEIPFKPIFLTFTKPSILKFFTELTAFLSEESKYRSFDKIQQYKKDIEDVIAQEENG